MRSVTTTVEVETSLGRLHAQLEGNGPPAVLWHSLFVDSTSWELLRPALARLRRLIVIDGPGHGASGPARGPFTLTDCAQAALAVLGECGATEPVDWIGNAWGGHVGLTLATRSPARLRSLATIGTPVQALGVGERLLRVGPLMAMYRTTGPSALLRHLVSDALLGADAATAQPDLSRRVIDAFADADRAAMVQAMRSVMLRRPDLGEQLPIISTPSIMFAGREDTGWPPARAQVAAARMPAGRATTVAGSGHVAPLLLAPEHLHRAIAEFWADPPRADDARV